MDAIDILGGMLGHKSSGSGKGADILKDIFRGTPRSGRPSPSARTSREPSPDEIARQAEELEDLLQVAQHQHAQRTNSPGKPLPRMPQPPPAPRPNFGPRSSEPFPKPAGSGFEIQRDEAAPQNERALVLVRAMVNAAKSDGQISQAEQQAILERVDASDREAIQFLRDEFAKPLDVREFAWSVPMGMEQEVYMMSLIAIDLDSNREANYLGELAQALRIPDKVRDQIHQRVGAPLIR